MTKLLRVTMSFAGAAIARKSIIFFTKYDELGASSRVRTHQYIKEYSKSFNVYVNPLLDQRYLKGKYKHHYVSLFHLAKLFSKRVYHIIRSRKYDIVWVEKELFPWFPSIFESYLSLINTKTVYDYDDAIHHVYDSHKYSIIRKFYGNKISRIMKKSTAVTVGNKYLFEYAKKAGAKKIIYLPTCVNTNILFNNNITRKDKIIIGWIGTPYTFKYVVKYLPLFKKLSQEQNVVFYFCEASSKLTIFDNFKNISWSEENEKLFLSEIDIGIMPLVDDYFERGKCGYKLLQYLSFSKPVIASPVGVNKEIIDQGVNGYLCRSMVDWEDSLKKLICDKELRNEMGENGKRKIENTYSSSIYLNTVYNLLQDINRFNDKYDEKL